MSMTSCPDREIALREAASRKVNSHLRQLCELTYRCLQTIDSDDLDALSTLLEQRQERMTEIDRLQNIHSTLASECGGPDDTHLEIERRDLLCLLNSLDSELIRLSAQKRDDLRADFQKVLMQNTGSAADHPITSRLLSRIG